MKEEDKAAKRGDKKVQKIRTNAVVKVGAAMEMENKTDRESKKEKKEFAIVHLRQKHKQFPTTLLNTCTIYSTVSDLISRVVGEPRVYHNQL